MRKFIALLILTGMVLVTLSLGVSAATVTISSPVEMTYVGISDGNYEYNVVATVNVSESGVACQEEVSILMFGNKDNSAFVSGNNLVNLTVDSIAKDYHIYYMNQEPADETGKVTFNFNVILPTPATTDMYYIWAGSETATVPGSAEGDNLGVNTQAVGISVSIDNTNVTPGTEVTLTPTVSNVFGNAVEKGNASIDYILKQDGNVVSGVIIDNVINTASLEGEYSVAARFTNALGQTVESESCTFTVAEPEDTTPNITGDADGDDKITVYDAVKVLAYVAGIGKISNMGKIATDVDGVAGLSTADATIILKYVARIINQF